MKSFASYMDEPANISDIMGCFQQLKNLAPYDYEQIFTKYILDKKSCQKIMKMFNNLARN